MILTVKSYHGIMFVIQGDLQGQKGQFSGQIPEGIFSTKIRISVSCSYKVN